MPHVKWRVIYIGIDHDTGKPGDLEISLNRETWSDKGWEVFTVLSSPDRIVFRKIEEQKNAEA